MTIWCQIPAFPTELYPSVSKLRMKSYKNIELAGQRRSVAALCSKYNSETATQLWELKSKVAPHMQATHIAVF